MDTTARRSALVATLAVLALAAGAPTVQQAVPDSDGGSQAPPGGESPTVGEAPSIQPEGSGGGSLDDLTALLLIAAFVAAVAFLAVNARSVAGVAVGAVLAVALLATLLVVFAGLGGGGGESLVAPGDGAGGPAGGSGGSTALLVPAVVVVAGLALLGGGALLVDRLGLTRDDAGLDDAGSDGSPAPDAVGETAGRAAERIRTGASAADNEVYRCWREMTRVVAVPRPETATPAEFAEAAVDAGVDEDDARELRALFETVRYGDADPTEGYERRALSVLERIEAAYGDDGSESGDGGAGGPAGESR